MTEEMLIQMIKSACELEYEEIEKRIKTEYPHIFSDEFNQKMDCLVMMEEDDEREQLESRPSDSLPDPICPGSRIVISAWNIDCFWGYIF